VQTGAYSERTLKWLRGEEVLINPEKASKPFLLKVTINSNYYNQQKGV
jgi:hypothetical protein